MRAATRHDPIDEHRQYFQTLRQPPRLRLRIALM
jgi:hypothetical protein